MTEEPIQVFEKLLSGDIKDELTQKPVTKYLEQITTDFIKDEHSGRSLDLNCGDDVFMMKEPLRSLLEDLMTSPSDTLSIMGDALKRVVKEKISEGFADEHVGTFHARTFNIVDPIEIGKIAMPQIGKLICVRGMVTKMTEIKPSLVNGTFHCNKCDDVFESKQEHVGFYKPPIRCGQCGAIGVGKFELLYEDSEYVDWQGGFLQQLPEELQSGQTPQGIKMVILDDIVNTIYPGDRVVVTGILRLSPSFKPTTSAFQDPTMNKFIEVVHITRLTEGEDIILSSQDLKDIKILSKKKNVADIIIDSICPEIFGYDEVKYGLALQSFGGVLKEGNEYGRLEIKASGDVKKNSFFARGDIHVLLAGDPSTGKSVDGKEKIYVRKNVGNRTRWESEKIEDFVNKLMQQNEKDVITKMGTRVLKLPMTDPIFTMSMDASTLKTRSSRIQEVSKHEADTVFQITTQSGRNIIVTPNHSFTTLVQGKMVTMMGKDLIIGNYLPIARKIHLKNDDTHVIDLSDVIADNELVETNKIREVITLVHDGTSSIQSGSMSVNMTTTTLQKYSNDPLLLPDDGYIRGKYDSSWFPRNIRLTESFGRIVGFYLAEGYVNITTTSFSNTDEEIKNLISRDLRSVFGKSTIHEKCVYVCQSSISKWFACHLGNGSGNKAIPPEFMATPKEFRRGLLSAYFSGDGWVEDGGVVATTKSESLARDISDILSTFGILAFMGTKTLKSGKYKGNTYYKVRISGYEMIKYRNEIGFACSRKQDQLELIINNLNKRTICQHYDMIPNFGTLLTDAVRDIGIEQPRNGQWRSLLAELRGKTRRQRVGRKYLERRLKTLEDICYKKNAEIPHSLLKLKTLVESDVFWDKIVQIKKIHEKRFVYDIGTDDDHFIVGGGNIIAHNSKMLSYMRKIAPRYQYTSGRKTSGVGVTASVVKDATNNVWTLEAGAVVLASGGVCTTGDSEFVLSNGQRMSFNDLFNEVESDVIYPKFKIFGLNMDTLKIEPFGIKKAIRLKNDKEIYVIKTRSGRTLNLTSDNEVLTCEDSRVIWKRINDMKQGDYIAVPKRIMIKKADNHDGTSHDPISPLLLKKYIEHAKTITPMIPQEVEDIIVMYYNDNHVNDDYLPRPVEGDILWDEIISITNMNADIVYDFVMDGTNNFVANDIVMHNCAIDELDKMRPEDRSALLEVMEDQTVSIAKAGIMATLVAKCAILSAMNPKNERYDEDLPFADNVNLSEVLRTRFDLIYVMRDIPNAKWDKDVARHIVQLHRGLYVDPQRDDDDDTSDGPISLSLLKKYIKHSKTIIPVLSQEVEDLIVTYYGDMRTATTVGDIVGFVPRDVSTCIRLAEANARMHLRKKVKKEDFEKARALVDYCKVSLCSDEDGEIDIGRVTGSGGKKQRDIREKIVGLIERLQSEDEHKIEGVDQEILKAKAIEVGLFKNEKQAKSQLRIHLERLEDEQKIYSPKKEPNHHTYKVA